MPTHLRLTVHDTAVDFYDFISSVDFESKARGLVTFLDRMPALHVQTAFARYVIFVIRTKPHGGESGGTWLPRNVGRAFLGSEAATGVPDVDLRRLVLDQGKGLIGIPENRWSRPLQTMKLTVLHEVGHAVDYTMNLSPPGATAVDFRGVTPVCGGRDPVKKHAVEAYARLIYAPARICRDVSSVDLSTCNARVSLLLKRSPAFALVPEIWWRSRGVRSMVEIERETEAERIRRQTGYWAAGMGRRIGMRYALPGPTGLNDAVVPSPREAARRYLLSEDAPPDWLLSDN